MSSRRYYVRVYGEDTVVVYDENGNEVGDEISFPGGTIVEIYEHGESTKDITVSVVELDGIVDCEITVEPTVPSSRDPEMVGRSQAASSTVKWHRPMGFAQSQHWPPGLRKRPHKAHDRQSVLPSELLETPVLIENVKTKRYLFSDGAPIGGHRGAEGGWKASSGFESPKVVGADANYYNRALWIIRPVGAHYLIENVGTKRYLFSDGAPISGPRGKEGGWKAASGFESPNVVGADANYYNLALWVFNKSGGNYLIESAKTHRYVFSDGAPIGGARGAEGGWKAASGFESPTVVGADANYYNRARWNIHRP